MHIDPSKIHLMPILAYYTYYNQCILPQSVLEYNTENFALSSPKQASNFPYEANLTYLYNGHGDVVKLVGDGKNTVREYIYDAFGNQSSPVSTDANPFRYGGQYYDKSTGNYYLRARYYDPVIGRFTREDPARDGTNWYLYCYNNPVRYIDPSGNVPVDTIVDLASLGWSLKDFVSDPNLGTFGMLAWDAVALITPYAPGSYVGKAAGAGSKILSKAEDYVEAGVWLMRPFERGREIEKALGGWGNNFPVIDWAKQTVSGKNGILENIKSIKSIDLTAKTYQSPSNLKHTLKKYIDTLSDYQGNNVYHGIRWEVKEGTGRTLEIAVPAVEMTAKQAEVFQEMVECQGIREQRGCSR